MISSYHAVSLALCMGAYMRMNWVAMLAIGGSAALALGALASDTPARAQTTAAACTDNQNRWLLVQNLKPVSIYLIKTRRAYSYGEWSDDYLGSTATPAGSSVFVLMPSTDCQCRADIQVTMESGTSREFTYNNVNYCSRTDGQRATLVVD